MKIWKPIALITFFVLTFAHNCIAQKKITPKPKASVNSLIPKPTALDTIAIAEHYKMYSCFLDTNYVCFQNYMAPELLTFFSQNVKTSFIETMREQMKSMGELSLAKHKTTRVVQSISENNVHQKIIESFLEMEIEGQKMVSLSYSIAFSGDAVNWKFMRLSSMSVSQMLEVFPIINKKFKIPENQIFIDKSLETVLKTYKIKYRRS